MATAPCLPQNCGCKYYGSQRMYQTLNPMIRSTTLGAPTPARTLVTKRYVVLVCKTWYQCAISFLYSAVILNHGRGVSSLRGTLLESEARAEASLTAAHSLGWYTRRFNMVMHDSQNRHEYGEEREQRMMYDILQCFPNLAQFFAGLRGRILVRSFVVSPYIHCPKRCCLGSEQSSSTLSRKVRTLITRRISKIRNVF